MTETEILDTDLYPTLKRRRDLLPIWIKVFLWIFLVFSMIVPFGLIFGILGFQFGLSIYGLETSNPLSITGLLIMLFFAFKGVVSFGLWTEKDWAINLALVDAVTGIVACAIVMLILPLIPEPNSYHFSLRLELIALIPYLKKMKKIKEDWRIR